MPFTSHWSHGWWVWTIYTSFWRWNTEILLVLQLAWKLHAVRILIQWFLVWVTGLYMSLTKIQKRSIKKNTSAQKEICLCFAGLQISSRIARWIKEAAIHNTWKKMYFIQMLIQFCLFKVYAHKDWELLSWRSNN